MLLEQSYILHMHFVQTAEFDLLPWQQKNIKFEKKIFKKKNLLLWSRKVDEVERLKKC